MRPVCCFRQHHHAAAAGVTNVLLVTFLIPISALMLGVGMLEEVIKAFEYAGMGCIFLGLVIIDGRALKWVLRTNRKHTTESGTVKGSQLEPES